MNKYTFPLPSDSSTHPFQERLWEWVQAKLRCPIWVLKETSLGALLHWLRGTPISTLRQQVIEISPAQISPGCLPPSCLPEAWLLLDIVLRDRCTGWYVCLPQKKIFASSIKPWYFCRLQVEEEKGVPDVSLTLKKMHSFSLILTLHTKEILN